MKPYVALGLTALARNAELRGTSWFLGHIGAAVIAGAFLLENEKMSEEARSLLKAQLDKVIAENELFFVPFEEAEAAPLTGFLEAIQQRKSVILKEWSVPIQGKRKKMDKGKEKTQNNFRRR